MTAQTAHNLERLAGMGQCDPGRVVDKLVRDRMVALREEPERSMKGENT